MFEKELIEQRREELIALATATPAFLERTALVLWNEGYAPSTLNGVVCCKRLSGVFLFGRENFMEWAGKILTEEGHEEIRKFIEEQSYRMAVEVLEFEKEIEVYNASR